MYYISKTISNPQLLRAPPQASLDLFGNDKVNDAAATQVFHPTMIKRQAMDDAIIKEADVILNTVMYEHHLTKSAKIWCNLGNNGTLLFNAS